MYKAKYLCRRDKDKQRKTAHFVSFSSSHRIASQIANRTSHQSNENCRYLNLQQSAVSVRNTQYIFGQSESVSVLADKQHACINTQRLPND